jgi:hypothetical protein
MALIEMDPPVLTGADPCSAQGLVKESGHLGWYRAGVAARNAKELVMASRRLACDVQ